MDMDDAFKVIEIDKISLRKDAKMSLPMIVSFVNPELRITFYVFLKYVLRSSKISLDVSQCIETQFFVNWRDSIHKYPYYSVLSLPLGTFATAKYENYLKNDEKESTIKYN